MRLRHRAVTVVSRLWLSCVAHGNYLRRMGLPGSQRSHQAMRSAGLEVRPAALLFDLDGTLVDSVELILASFRHAFKAHLGEAPPDDAWITGIGTPLITQIRGLVPGNEQLAQEIAASYRAYQRDHHDAMLREFEGVRDTLELLCGLGHPTGLVTSKMGDMAHRALTFTRLADLVDVIVSADICERHKPDPEPVHMALRALDYRPHEAFFVGDSTHDIVAGNAAGVVTVAALWGPFSRETLERASPTYLIEHIRELPGLLSEHLSRAS
ncbi:MAG TPA: HAD-IA family hydrolase [Gemmatimonadaceae bacterium]|nr:HAD-IA family hydrolase [Gemmatimonadaceae bacterium]